MPVEPERHMYKGSLGRIACSVGIEDRTVDGLVEMDEDFIVGGVR